jgi:phage terminase small subunit
MTPLVRIARDPADQMPTLASEFALTPLARSRMRGIEPPRPPDGLLAGV